MSTEEFYHTKSVQKLLKQVQKIRGKQKQFKNPALNINTIKKSKNIASTKTKRKTKEPKLPETTLQKNVSKNSMESFDQRSITEFFKTVKNKSSDCRFDENSKIGEKQAWKMDDEPLFFNRNNFSLLRKDAASFKTSGLSVSEFQNPNYVSYLSSRNDEHNIINYEGGIENVDDLIEIETYDDSAKDENYEVISKAMSINADFDAAIERKKNISDVFYNKKSEVNNSIKKGISVDHLTVANRNEKIGSDRNTKVSMMGDWLWMWKKDQDRLTNLLNEIKFVNDTITKAKQDISKFFINQK